MRIIKDYHATFAYFLLFDWNAIYSVNSWIIIRPQKTNSLHIRVRHICARDSGDQTAAHTERYIRWWAISPRKMHRATPLISIDCIAVITKAIRYGLSFRFINALLDSKVERIYELGHRQFYDALCVRHVIFTLEKRKKGLIEPGRYRRLHIVIVNTPKKFNSAQLEQLS